MKRTEQNAELIQYEKLVCEYFSPAKCKLWKSNDLRLTFDDDDIPFSSEKGLHLSVNDVKFCIYDYLLQLPILTMDFFSIRDSFTDIKGKKGIRLELIYLHDKKMRNIGVGGYYINRLIDFAIEQGFEYMKVVPIPTADNFKGNFGNMTAFELAVFYEKFERPNFPVITYIP